jgi:maleylacetate reductase
VGGGKLVIVRWGLGELAGVLAEVGVSRPLLVTTERWQDVDLPRDRVFTGVRSHVPSDTVEAATAAASAADGLLAVGGGSAIDTAKAVSAATGLPVVSVPTTYSGAEWTRSFGVRDEARGVKGGGGGARPVAIVYEPELTLTLPSRKSGGTALNALAHCAEALYAAGRNEAADRDALAGARLISAALPRVLDDGRNLEARRELLEGALHGGAALAAAGLALAHAMAQALGGRYGAPHGALNAICLPPVLRFNAPAARDEIARFADAMGTADAAARVEELARSAGFTGLRDLGVPEAELAEVADAVVVRPGAKANPRPASPAEIRELLASVW